MFINHCEDYHRLCSNLYEQIEQFSLLCYPLPIDQITLNSIQRDLTQMRTDLNRHGMLTFEQILTIWRNLVKIKEQLDQQNRLPVTIYKRPHDFDEIIPTKKLDVEESETEDEDLIYLETVPAPPLTVDLCETSD